MKRLQESYQAPITIPRARHRARKGVWILASHDFFDLKCLEVTLTLSSPLCSIQMSLLVPKSSAEAHVPKRRRSCEKGSKIGPYILLEPTEGGRTYRAVNRHTEAELTCKVYPAKSYPEVMAPYAALPSHPNIARLAEVIVGDQNVYIFFEPGKDNMHDLSLFRQMAEAVAHCHQHGIVLRDIKLRKFVFADRERSKLLLEHLEDAQVLMGSDDALMDKHGCPGSYSGKAADIWSLGVALYTLLVGCYPFQGTKPITLFAKICRGCFTVPGDLSPKAQCLIRCLLRRDPAERLTASGILLHPWLASNPVPKALGVSPLAGQGLEQVVPEMGSCRMNLDKLREVDT
uniref:Tribbles pseudokinase 3 n=1 Tax=Naja naja TaxID=35670 RepID=A0A8C6VGE3_NAJNA